MRPSEEPLESRAASGSNGASGYDGRGDVNPLARSEGAAAQLLEVASSVGWLFGSGAFAIGRRAETGGSGEPDDTVWREIDDGAAHDRGT